MSRTIPAGSRTSPSRTEYPPGKPPVPADHPHTCPRCARCSGTPSAAARDPRGEPASTGSAKYGADSSSSNPCSGSQGRWSRRCLCRSIPGAGRPSHPHRRPHGHPFPSAPLSRTCAGSPRRRGFSSPPHRSSHSPRPPCRRRRAAPPRPSPSSPCRSPHRGRTTARTSCPSPARHRRAA